MYHRIGYMDKNWRKYYTLEFALKYPEPSASSAENNFRKQVSRQWPSGQVQPTPLL